jgi:hypothetical protein
MLDCQGILRVGSLQLLQLSFQIGHLLQVFFKHILYSFLFGCGQLKSLWDVVQGLGIIPRMKQMLF